MNAVVPAPAKARTPRFAATASRARLDRPTVGDCVNSQSSAAPAHSQKTTSGQLVQMYRCGSNGSATMIAACATIAVNTTGLRRASLHAAAMPGTPSNATASAAPPIGMNIACKIASDDATLCVTVATTNRGPPDRSPSMSQLVYGPYFADSAAGMSLEWRATQSCQGATTTTAANITRAAGFHRRRSARTTTSARASVAACERTSAMHPAVAPNI